MGKVKNRSVAWLSYTSIRLALVALVWLVLQFFTPIRGLLAIALALLISALFSIIFLSKQRDAMSESVFGFFRKLNERIDASAAKEDYLDAEPKAQEDSVNQQDDSGGLEDGDQGRPAGSSSN